MAYGSASLRPAVAYDGEVVLARQAVGPKPDPSLSLRVAAAAAISGRPIARATLEWLARFAEPMPVPWPAEARRAFVTMLGAGPDMLPVWEACDRYGIVGGWLPDWTRLRGMPQHHPIHVYTVDRHVVQAVVEAGAYLRTVSRPDLVLVGALLHDFGKGLDDDHAAAGAPMAAAIATTMGFDATDAERIGALVRLHLLLPTVATRRDIADPVTIAGVADTVGDITTLELLHALCLADAKAAGPSATSPWKTRLIGQLVENVRRLLSEGAMPREPSPGDRAGPDGPLPAVEITDDEVTIAAIDRPGLLAAVAGVLALHRLEVVGADTWTTGQRAVVRVGVAPRFGQAPDGTHLAIDLRSAAVGEFPADRLARVAASGPADRGRRATVTEPVVTWHGDATDAAVLELRAADAPGLLYRVTRALEQAGANVRSARVATLGGDVVDAFYLTGPWPDAEVRARLTEAVLAAAT